MQIHIRFLNAHESLDRGTVKHALVIQRFFQLARRDRHILQCSENICKLKTDKLNVLFVYHTNNILFGILAHLLHSFICFHIIHYFAIGKFPAEQIERAADRHIEPVLSQFLQLLNIGKIPDAARIGERDLSQLPSISASGSSIPSALPSTSTACTRNSSA